MFLHKFESSCCFSDYIWTMNSVCWSNSCFNLEYWAVASEFVLIILKNISNNIFTLSQVVISWCWGFLRQPFSTAGGGGGGTHSGQGDLVWKRPVCLTEMSVCLSVCQTCQRWSHTIPILPQRRGDPASLTCPPTLLMKETTPGRMDGSSDEWVESKEIQVSKPDTTDIPFGYVHWTKI